MPPGRRSTLPHGYPSYVQLRTADYFWGDDDSGGGSSSHRIGPGSRNHWSDGIGRSDWSGHGGSESYRAEHAYASGHGGYELRGNFYTSSGSLITSSNGKIYVECYACGDYAYSDNGNDYYYNTYTEVQTGGWPVPVHVGEWFVRNFKDISDSRYPGIKIYETSLIADGTAVTLPGFGILVHPYYQGESRTKVLQHEYGHFLDYMFSGDINRPSLPGSPNIPIVSFYLMLGVPSLFNAGTGIGGDHESYWTEIRANQWAETWFGDTYIRDEKNYPTK